MNIPQELVALILRSIDIKSILRTSTVCKRLNQIVRNVEVQVLQDRVPYKHNCVIILKKISFVIELHGQNLKELWSIRDARMASIFSYKLSIDVLDYDNECILSGIIEHTKDLDMARRCFNISTRVKDKKTVSPRCFRWLKNYIRNNSPDPIRHIYKVIINLIINETWALAFFQKTWGDIDETAYFFARFFIDANQDEWHKKASFMLWLLYYPSLLYCSKWNQIAIHIMCATNDILWERLQQLILPRRSRGYNRMLDNDSWSFWTDISPQCYFKQRVVHYKDIISKRLRGIISRRHLLRLLE